MAVPRIRLAGSQREDLAEICSLGADALARVAVKLESSQFTIRRSRIERLIKDVVGMGPGEVLSRVLFGLAGEFRRSLLSPEELLEAVSRSIGELPGEDARFDNWRECVPRLSRLLEGDSIRLAAKALDISYDFERVYIAGRLLTSVRPVFDNPREDIIGATIVQTLRLDYIAPNGDQSNISVALDLDDIRRLREECEIAIRKAAKAQDTISQGCRFEAIIPGEEQG